MYFVEIVIFSEMKNSGRGKIDGRPNPNYFEEHLPELIKQVKETQVSSRKAAKRTESIVTL